MKVAVDAIKALRDETWASVKDCRDALEASGGDTTKAKEWLKQRGAHVAQTRHGRATSQGRVQAYVHHDGRLGALVEVNCETDFVARTEDFQQFCRDLALHIAAMNPTFLAKDDAGAQGVSPEEAKATCLLEQPFVKDPGTTVGGLLHGLIAKTGENCVIRRFVRYAVGEPMDSPA